MNQIPKYLYFFAVTIILFPSDQVASFFGWYLPEMATLVLTLLIVNWFLMRPSSLQANFGAAPDDDVVRVLNYVE